MEALKVGFRMGLSPAEFFRLTPWQTRQCFKTYLSMQEQDHDHKAWFMWHNAVLPKLKHFPPLSDFTTKKKKKVKYIDQDAILLRLEKYQQAYEANSKT